MSTATLEPVRIAAQPGPQEDFLATDADIAFYGGAAGGGKTFAALLEPLRHTENPRFGALILRRTNKEVLNVGGLWSESEGIYPLAGAEPRMGSLQWNFPSGAVVKFDHLEHEADKYKYQGSQIPLIVFDELTRFSATQFWYMLSRSRSTCGVRPYVRGTCNPDADSFVAKIIEWWIDKQTGYPIPERSGVVRWFVRIADELIWAADPKTLTDRYAGSLPKSFTFIAAKLADNPALTDKDPGYKANLDALPMIERMRLKEGNWKIRDEGGQEWPAEYFDEIWCDAWPHEKLITVVALDPSLGKTEASRKNRVGDYSAFVALMKGMDGRYYVDADIQRRPTERMVGDGVRWMAQLRPDAFGCETNGFQELLRSMFEQSLPQAGVTMTQVYGIPNYEMPKVTRIRLLSQLLERGRIKVLSGSPGGSLLVEQLKSFPCGDHDDGPDALQMAIRLCEDLLSGSIYAEPTPEVLFA